MKKAKNKRPNVIITLADDMRYDTIRALGNPEILTPFLDRFVKEGTAMMNVHTMGSTHAAVCIPCRGMLHTGCSLFRLPESLYDGAKNIIPAPSGNEKFQTLGEILRGKGYQTYGFGKWHNGRESFARSFSGGGNIFFGGMTFNQWENKVYDFDPSGEYFEENAKIKTAHSTDLFADAAIDCIKKISGEKPFFIHLAFTSPHDPRTAPPEYHSKYAPQELSLPQNFLPEHPFDTGALKGRDEMLAPFPRTPECVRRHMADYYAMITHMDAALGRIDNALREKGLLENTIHIHLSDHGIAIGQHGLFGKQNLYEHSVHIPMIIRGPGVPKNFRSNVLCYIHDLFATVLELCGFKAPKGSESLSFKPVLQKKKDEHRPSLFAAYQNYQRSIRDQQFKLIEFFVDDSTGKGARKTLLFDILKDPYETNDLSKDSGYKETLAILRELLKKSQKNAGDSLKLKL